MRYLFCLLACLLLTSCTVGAVQQKVIITAPQPSAMPAATATLIDCAEMTPVPDRGSILATFTPSYPCELENVSKHVDFCMMHASPELAYPCSQTESVEETVMGEGASTLLIQHDYHFSAGCWHGINSDTRSLRVCDRESGESTIFAQDVLGDPILSPDGNWFAFVAAEPGSDRFKSHLFCARSDGTDLVQLDTQPFPQHQSVGIQILRWSEDGKWLEVQVWDGREGGYHGYRIRSDGSGELETFSPQPIQTPTLVSPNATAPSSLPVPPTAPPIATLTPLASPGDAQIVSFYASPSPVDPTGSVTLYWQARGGSSVSIDWWDKQMDSPGRSGLPLVGQLSIELSEVKFDGDQVNFDIGLEGADGKLMIDENGYAIANRISVPLKTEMKLLSFTASPDTIDRGGTVTLAWDVPGASRVGISRYGAIVGDLGQGVSDLAPSGSMALPVPDEHTTSVAFFLSAHDANGVSIYSQPVTVNIRCRYDEHIARLCPLTHQYVQAAFQAFENGFLVWRGDTREIYAIYNQGGREIFPDTWNEGDPVNISETPPAGRFAPARGFGKLWSTQPGVREKLGWGTAQEVGYTMLVETVIENTSRYSPVSTFFKLPDERIVRFYGGNSWELLP